MSKRKIEFDPETWWILLYLEDNKPWLVWRRPTCSKEGLVFNYTSRIKFNSGRGQLPIPVYSTIEDKEWTDTNILSKPFKTPYKNIEIAKEIL